MRRKRCWKIFREKLNKKYRFASLANNFIYNLIIFVLMIFNCAILISAEVISDHSTMGILYFIDEILLYFYLVDFIIKVFAFGFEMYFQDFWNKFDFLVLLISFFSEFLLLAYSKGSFFDLDMGYDLSKAMQVRIFFKLNEKKLLDLQIHKTLEIIENFKTSQLSLCGVCFNFQN